MKIKYNKIIKFGVLLILLVVQNMLIAQDTNRHIKVGIDEKLGTYLPLDARFRDEEGKTVILKDLISKPTVLSLVYYHCPGICSPLLNGLSEVVDRVDMEPGKDFNVLTLSFDNRETPQTAKRWKNEHLAGMRRRIPEQSWRFLTGDSTNIRKVTDAVGFYFKADGDTNFLHMASLVVLAPDGKIIRYIFGTQYLPFDLKMAIIEAQKGTPSPTINKILSFCYSYDRQGGKYLLNITKIVGSLMLLGVFVFFGVLTLKGRIKKSKERI